MLVLDKKLNLGHQNSTFVETSRSLVVSSTSIVEMKKHSGSLICFANLFLQEKGLKAANFCSIWKDTEVRR